MITTPRREGEGSEDRDDGDGLLETNETTVITAVSSIETTVIIDLNPICRPNFNSVKVHHGGTFVNIHGDLQYIDGEETIWDNCDIDRWSFFELKDGLAEMGHKEKYDMWLADPNVRLKDTLRPIVDDRGAMEMGLVGLAVGMVDLYLLHTPFEFTEILALPSNEPPPAPDTDDGKDNDGVEEDNDGDGVEEDNDGDDDKEDGDQSDDSDADSAADIRFNDSEEEDVEEDYFDSGDGAKEQRTKRRYFMFKEMFCFGSLSYF
ncbi:hypothetical protein G2W53_010244 [Senna tora]|uniref:PB1-like domain-containing protein n=1 Tax=Senna tora TaxID=362788 RepID=A0A834WYY6_9FABA|nr:hypothetical protein G2W53_010244 [Senna tora]